MTGSSGENGDESSYICSFCGKSQSEVRRLIAGPDQVYICDECVLACFQIINGSNSEHAHDTKHEDLDINNLPNPRLIHEHLSSYVIGQQNAKKVLSVGVYNHYKKIGSQFQDKTEDISLDKTNILLVGPTGTGKTLLAQTLARILDVPFAIVDATSLTEAGYVGEDVENILLKLIQNADNDISRAERGIIYIDEIDKTSRRSANPSITRDVSGEGVQQALLKIIEGATVNVPPQGGRKHPQQEFIQIDTSGILFICGGAFEGIIDLVEKRILKDKNSMGFGTNVGLIDDIDKGDIISQLSHDDILAYGMIPEFVGRMPLVVGLKDLGKSELLEVLSTPKNSLVAQYTKLFNLDQVDLEFTDEALNVIADLALDQKTGARALRTVMEDLLLDLMYEIPSLDNVKKCVISAEAVRKIAPPDLFDDSNRPINWTDIRKSA